MGEAAQKFVASIVMDDRLGDDRAQLRHPLAEPSGNAAVVKRQISAAGAPCHRGLQEGGSKPNP